MNEEKHWFRNMRSSSFMHSGRRVSSNAIDRTGLSLDPTKMPTIGTVDERFQSYNIEMVEVIGGRFWKPYGIRHKQKYSAGARLTGGFHSGRHRPEPISISSAHRSFKSAIAKTGSGVKPRVCASQRYMGQ